MLYFLDLVGVAVFTMFFTGGLIPNYVLVSALGLRNSVWAIALPNAINVFNLLVMKSFFESLPVELQEAAAVDGLGTYVPPPPGKPCGTAASPSPGGTVTLSGNITDAQARYNLLNLVTPRSGC